MRGRFLLVPLASVAIVAPAHATVYLTVEQAQQILFPGAEFTRITARFRANRNARSKRRQA
jgi:hypothetical protein